MKKKKSKSKGFKKVNGRLVKGELRCWCCCMEPAGCCAVCCYVLDDIQLADPFEWGSFFVTYRTKQSIIYSLF